MGALQAVLELDPHLGWFWYGCCVQPAKGKCQHFASDLVSFPGVIIGHLVTTWLTWIFFMLSKCFLAKFFFFSTVEISFQLSMTWDNNNSSIEYFVTGADGRLIINYVNLQWSEGMSLVRSTIVYYCGREECQRQLSQSHWKSTVCT